MRPAFRTRLGHLPQPHPDLAQTYSRYAVEHPGELRVVGVAEPREYHRESMARRHRIPEDCVFSDWVEVARRPRFADAVCITTQDSMHCAPAIAFAALGYHILLEKPMAVTADECRRIVEAVKRAGVVFAVGHVLRYTPYMQKMRELLSGGAVGEIVNIQHLEPIGSWHFAHSYVRGHWRRESESTFLLMAKCCHDVDLLRYLMGRRCTRVSSFGSLYLFEASKRPAGAADRCVECPVEGDCAYSAKRIYLERASHGDFGWPVSALLDGPPSVEAVHEALATGPYGRCVWACDNDVVDNQVVTMEFEGGATASLTTVAFTEAVCQRRTRVFGTLGELDGDGDTRIRHFDFLTGTSTVHECQEPPADTAMRGHNGADFFLMRAFVDAVRHGDPSRVLTGPDETLESHLMVFAAEEARRRGSVLAMDDASSVPSAASVASSAAAALLERGRVGSPSFSRSAAPAVSSPLGRFSSFAPSGVRVPADDVPPKYKWTPLRSPEASGRPSNAMDDDDDDDEQ